MDFQNLTDVDILELQYSLLEELKFKRTQTDNEHNDPYEGYAIGRSKVEKSPYRKNIEDMLNKGFSSREISRYLQDNYDENISHTAINTYKQNHISKTEEYDTTQKTVKRDSKEYNRFREVVLKRDKVCQCCGSKDDLVVHHVLPFKQYNSIGADPNNGVVLCKACHNEYHSQFGYKRNNNVATFGQFLRDYGMDTQTQFQIPITPKQKVQQIFNEIKTIEKKLGKCPEHLLISKFTENPSISESDVKWTVKALINKGLVYSPSEGDLKAIQ